MYWSRETLHGIGGLGATHEKHGFKQSNRDQTNVFEKSIFLIPQHKPSPNAFLSSNLYYSNISVRSYNLYDQLLTAENQLMIKKPC